MWVAYYRISWYRYLVLIKSVYLVKVAGGRKNGSLFKSFIILGHKYTICLLVYKNKAAAVRGQLIERNNVMAATLRGAPAPPGAR